MKAVADEGGIEAANRTLVIMTEGFPFASGEAPFIAPELHHLKEHFGRIILAPRVAGGTLPPLPENVTATQTLANEAYDGLTAALLRGFSSKQFWNELAQYTSLLHFPKTLLRLALYAGRSRATATWLDTLIPRLTRDGGKVVVYSYWLMAGATGAALARSKLSNIRVVSRCHGFDLYLERYTPRFIPFRRITLNHLDHVFTISDHGATYLRQQFNTISNRITTARLGVGEQRHRSLPSRDGVTRFASCSNVVPVKRVDHIFASLNRLSKYSPQRRFEWSHFGDGPGLESLRALVSAERSQNFECRLYGQVSNNEVLKALIANPVDCFINLSESEGISVSVMEALSCAIPVFATRVGGMTEAVDASNGWLVDPSASPDEIAGMLRKIDFSREERRDASKSLWERRFNADRQYASFAANLSRI
jgi:colanic acid/amylovoran biosynthesis glycosyltransferase